LAAALCKRRAGGHQRERERESLEPRRRGTIPAKAENDASSKRWCFGFLSSSVLFPSGHPRQGLRPGISPATVPREPPKRSRHVCVVILASALLIPAAALADTTYRITIVNPNRAQPLSPPVVAIHRAGVALFTVGAPASEGLRLVAEEGDPAVLAAALEASSAVADVAVGNGPLMPGQSTTVEVTSKGNAVFLSVVSMLGTTNDAFIAIDSYQLNEKPWMLWLDAPAFDAGTEENTESCQFVLGPPCNAIGSRDPVGAEGKVLSHNGIHGIGDLEPAMWDFGFPAARVRVVRLTGNR
jgi:hypothetical protein